MDMNTSLQVIQVLPLSSIATLYNLMKWGLQCCIGECHLLLAVWCWHAVWAHRARPIYWVGEVASGLQDRVTIHQDSLQGLILFWLSSSPLGRISGMVHLSVPL